MKSVSLPQEFDLFPAALLVVREFGGLTFKNASGFLKLDPATGQEIAAEIKSYERKISRKLYPLGIVEGGDTIYVLMDEGGVVYSLAGSLVPLASSFNIAIEYLAVVFAVNQLQQAEDLKRNGLWGKCWNMNDP